MVESLEQRVGTTRGRWFLWMCAVLCSTGAQGIELRGVKPTSVNEIDYVSLGDVAAYHGLRVKAEGLRLRSAKHDFEFAPATRRAVYNGEMVYLHEAPAELEPGQWGIASADLRSLVDPMLRPALYLPSNDPVVVVVDPGHGGQDEGATNDVGLVEKRLTLDICRKIREQLAGRDLEVLLTRDADYAMELEERARFVAQRQADLFISLHFNSSPNGAAEGVETYVLPVVGHRSTSDNGETPVDPAVYPGNTFDGSNMLLAQAIHRRMVRTLHAKDRGIRKARFVVLREAPCPAALVECGFLTNDAETQKIRSSFYRDAIATSISAGILDVLDKRGVDSGSPAGDSPEGGDAGVQEDREEPRAPASVVPSDPSTFSRNDSHTEPDSAEAPERNLKPTPQAQAGVSQSRSEPPTALSPEPASTPVPAAPPRQRALLRIHR